MANALTVQFLAWVAERPRTRADAMEAWRSSCPRLTIWEDATIDRLICIENGHVVLTARGRTMLDGAWELAGQRRPATPEGAGQDPSFGRAAAARMRAP
jgi:hypothetical protein